MSILNQINQKKSRIKNPPT